MAYLRRGLLLSPLILIVFLTGAALAAEGVPSPQHAEALPSIQFWSLALGAVVPLATYVLNHFAPWVDERVKATVLLVLSAAAGALYQLAQAGDLGFDTETFQVVATAVIGAFGAHALIWKPSTISTALGGGRDAAPRKRVRRK